MSENVAQTISSLLVQCKAHVESQRPGLHPCEHKIPGGDSRSVKCLGAISDFHTNESHPYSTPSVEKKMTQGNSSVWMVNDLLNPSAHDLKTILAHCEVIALSRALLLASLGAIVMRYTLHTKFQ